LDVCKQDLEDLKNEMGIPSVVAVDRASATITSNVASSIAAPALDDEFTSTIDGGNVGEYGGFDVSQSEGV
jgi:hypothetical protein